MLKTAPFDKIPEYITTGIKLPLMISILMNIRQEAFCIEIEESGSVEFGWNSSIGQ